VNSPDKSSPCPKSPVGVAIPPARSRLRQAVGAGLRMLLGFGLAFLLLRYTLHANRTELSLVLRQASKPLLLAALVLYGVVILITVCRWGVLLRVQGIHLPAWELVRLTMIGVFFNMAIPGAVGGDLVKMGYIARLAPGRRTEAVLTIMLDRIIGLLALFFVATVMVLLSLSLLAEMGRDDRALQMAAYLVGVGSMGGITAVVLVEFRAVLVRHGWIARLLGLGRRVLPETVVHVVERLAAALDLYRRKRGSVLAAFALALSVHSLLAIDFYCIGVALGEKRLTLGNYFLTTQVANAAGAIPITPSGVGTRDAVAARFFRAMHADPELAGAIPVTLSLIIVFWSLVGAGVFVFSRGARRAWSQGLDERP